MVTVYGLTNELGQIMYVGQTSNPVARFSSHGRYVDGFDIAGMATLAFTRTRQAANRLERKWIDFFGMDNLYNMKPGGTCGHKVRVPRSITYRAGQAQLNIYMDQALRDRLDSIVRVEGRTIRSVVVRALRNELKRGPQP